MTKVQVRGLMQYKKEQNVDLNKQEFRDAVCLRFNKRELTFKVFHTIQERRFCCQPTRQNQEISYSLC